MFALHIILSSYIRQDIPIYPYFTWLFNLAYFFLPFISPYAHVSEFCIKHERQLISRPAAHQSSQVLFTIGSI